MAVTQYNDPSYLEAVYAALFALLKSATYVSGVSLASSQRVVELPSEVAPANQPCLMLVQGPMRVEQKEFSLPKWIFTAVAVIYVRTSGAAASDQNPVPATIANYLIWGIGNVFDPGSNYERQTLGGLVYHAWLEGEVFMETQDQQMIITIPIYMLAGTSG